MAAYEYFNDGLAVAEKMSDAQIASLVRKDADGRLALATKWIAGLVAKDWTEAQAQAWVFGMLGEANRRSTNRSYMSDWTEKMREELSKKLSAFGDSAYPLTENQFASAVKAAW